MSTTKSASTRKSAAKAAGLKTSSAEPLYRQLADRLLAQIDAGELAAGEQLASEPELMQLFQVSRVTVRQAIALLQKRGRVIAKRGKGTFVTESVVQHDLSSLQGFYDALMEKGVEPQTRLLEYSGNAGALDDGCPAGLKLPVRLKRLYSVGGKPFALVTGYLPEGAAGLGEQRAERLMVYQILEQYLGLRIGRAQVTIRCQRAPKDVGRLLGLKATDQALVMERTSFTQAEVPCEFMRIFVIPERFEFQLRVTGALEIARAVQPVPRVAKSASSTGVKA
jgi:GntR family transcriptional regulator